jgi:hypothetical protein
MCSSRGRHWLDGRWGVQGETVVTLLGVAALGPVAALAPPPRRRGPLGRLVAATAVAILALVLDAVRILWPSQLLKELLSVGSELDGRGAWLRIELFTDVLTGLVVLLLLAALAGWWRRHWFPAVLLVGSAWAAVALGPVGLLLVAVGRVGLLFGVLVRADVVAWGGVSLAVCLAVAVLAAVARWSVGRPMMR